jgi:N-acetylgalactosamine-N,N'-diacetylbacillosaminyl-diphospho-undecaprenol 4-alpha-N-acetylgalactosaminyltransferase
MQPPKTKLLITINTLQRGGAERVVWLLLNHLQHQFDVHFALYTNSIEYPLPPNIKYFCLNQPLNQNKILRVLKLPLMVYKMYQYCKTQGIQVSVSFLYRPCYINALMKAWFGFKGKIIMCERTHQTTVIASQTFAYRWFSKIMIRYSYQRAHLMLANSHAIQTDLVEKFKITTPIKVIYNPIDLQFIQNHINTPTTISVDAAYFNFVNVGGFRREKNHLLLIQAFFIIRDLPCKLYLVGGGVLDADLRQKVNDLGLQDKVIFCGFTDNPFNYVHQANCFVLSSDVEGFPNVLIEALACGKAVISTDCSSGPRELLAPKTNLHHRAQVHYELGEYGILTPVNDIASLAMAMKKMYTDAALRQSFEAKAKERAEQFDVHEIKKYFEIAFNTV